MRELGEHGTRFEFECYVLDTSTTSRIASRVAW